MYVNPSVPSVWQSVSAIGASQHIRCDGTQTNAIHMNRCARELRAQSNRTYGWCTVRVCAHMRQNARYIDCLWWMCAVDDAAAAAAELHWNRCDSMRFDWHWQCRASMTASWFIYADVRERVRACGLFASMCPAICAMHECSQCMGPHAHKHYTHPVHGSASAPCEPSLTPTVEPIIFVGTRRGFPGTHAHTHVCQQRDCASARSIGSMKHALRGIVVGWRCGAYSCVPQNHKRRYEWAAFTVGSCFIVLVMLATASMYLLDSHVCEEYVI